MQSNMKDPTSTLELLTGEADPGAFIENHWNGRYLVTHGARERFIGRVLPDMGYDLDHLLTLYRSPVMVYGKEVLASTGGLTDRIVAPHDAARSWYDRKAALEFDFLDAYVPALRDAALGLARDLRLPEGTFSKAIAYASATGGGLTAHFDAYANFVMQLSGHKVWRLAANTAFTAPVEHYSMSEYPLVPASLRLYQTGPMPQDYQTCSEAVELQPGSALFVPRGWWHATEASGESLSVNLTFSVPTWLDLVIAELRDRLVARPRWREHVLTANLEESRTAVADELLAEAAAAIEQIDPDGVLAQQAAPHDIYQLALATFHEAQGTNFTSEP
jgi:50S ribosomal protein L16 3-hydroxylase